MMRLLVHRQARRVVFAAGCIGVAVVLILLDWPWWVWVPAAVIGGVLATLGYVLLGYAYYRVYRDRLLAQHRRAPATTRDLNREDR